ncbi:hypothetical protein [Cellulomonas triticagri]|uniref:Uncharacterized protein n=1 Tax=Cellulomonas triticagri TaxID=2483352 RepID=A0A3M2JID4_9CELL|nr:hypothetical protein [Cellulomonas triticagri]RMI12834.1 hypothetical protein EBM89_06955 [Cellulomonas triticagri]
MAAVGPALLLGATVMLGVQPELEEISSVRAQTADQIAANEVQLRQNTVLAERNADIASVRAVAEELHLRVPEVLDQERLSRELHDRAVACGMTLSSFTQGGAEVVEDGPGYVRVPLSVSFVGPEGVVGSLALLALLQAAPGEPYGEGYDLQIQSVTMSGEEGDTGQPGESTLSVSGFLVLSAVIPVDDDEEMRADEELVS